MTTIVHDTAEALCLCAEYNLYLKPIAKITVSVALPQLKLPGKSISNWEVMERVKAMVSPEQFSALRISKSTMDFIRFEGEVENKGVVKTLLGRLDGKSIKLSGFTDILKVRAVENKVDFPTRHDWDSFFRDAKDMNETLPGERPDTIHLEGLPCRWFSQRESQHPDRPSEEVLTTIFKCFGQVRNVDIPMLDPYREEMLDKNFSTFSFGGHLNFEAYVQYQEYCGFTKAMDTLRGMKLMFKGEDGKAVACNIKVAFDTSKHLSDLALKRRAQERLKLQELERQREEQKRREKEEEDRRKEEERKQKEQEEHEKERKREERSRKREQKLREREERRNLKRVKRRQEEEQKKLQVKIAMEERRLLLAQRNLESIRLVAELLARAKALKQQQQEKERAEREEQERQEKARRKEELAHLQELEACRCRQEEELRRVEVEKERALDLQRREKELREKLLGNLLKNSSVGTTRPTVTRGQAEAVSRDETSIMTSGNGMVGLLGLVSRVQGPDAKEHQPLNICPQVPEKNRAPIGREEMRSEEDNCKRGKVERREAGTRGKRESKHSRERWSEMSHSQKERRSHSQGKKRHFSSHSRRRSYSHRRSSSRRRRSYSHHGSRRRNCHHSSSSSSCDRSSSSSGSSYSKRSNRRHYHRYSRSSSRSTSRMKDKSSHSHDNQKHRLYSCSYNRNRSRSKRH